MVVDITVRGEAEGRYPAERAVLTLVAAIEESSNQGRGRQEVYDQAVATQQAITAQAARLVESGAVTTWSSDQVAVSTHRPWRDDGTQGPPVHVAHVTVVAEFTDFERLGGFVDHWAGRDGVEIAGISWDVLPGNRRTYEATLRNAAVDDAVARAQGFADALRGGRVVAKRIADAGLLGDGSGGAPGPYAVKAFEASMTDGGGGVRLTPEQVVIKVAVDAGFTTE